MGAMDFSDGCYGLNGDGVRWDPTLMNRTRTRLGGVARVPGPRLVHRW